MTAAFEDSRFKAARSVGDLAGGNVVEKLQAVFAEPAVAHVALEINGHDDKTY